MFYTRLCESVNGFAVHNAQGCSGCQREPPRPGGTAVPNRRVNPGWRGGCRCFVVGAAQPQALQQAWNCASAQAKGCTPPRAGDLSQSCRWLLSIGISSRRCLVPHKSKMPQPRRAGYFPRRDVEFQHPPFLFFGIRLTHMQDTEFVVFLLE